MEQKPPKPTLRPPPAKAKPNLIPPSAARSISRDARLSRSKLSRVAWFSVFAAGVLGVVVLLPRLITRPVQTPVPTLQLPKPVERLVPTPVAPRKISEPKKIDQMMAVPRPRESEEFQAPVKAEAERVLRTLLQQQAQLENEGVKIWGGAILKTSYPDVLEKISVGHTHFDAKRFDEALTIYREASALFKQLRNSRQNRLQDALRAGSEALQRQADDDAQSQFQIALSIDPVNPRATHGMNRARNLKRVTELTRQGRSSESAGKLDEAKSRYAEAIALDGDYRPAQDHLRRLNEFVVKRDYHQEMSTASEALARKEFKTAQSSLALAGKLRPDAPEVRELSKDVNAARQLDELERIRGDAAQYEKDERWKVALNAYERALSIDKNANFAIRGKTRAEKFLTLKQQFDYYLTHPDHLQSPERLAHARKLLDVASAIPNSGANLRESSERLRSLIDRFSSPRPVILRSDEETQVTVFQVGRFGQFTEHRLALTPGQYTAVGTRMGYRDVRIRFRVAPDSKETIIEIRCKERI